MRETYTSERWHTASLDGRAVRFRSFYKRQTFGLHSDAVQACKEAGLYRGREDWDAVLVDGMRHGCEI